MTTVDEPVPFVAETPLLHTDLRVNTPSAEVTHEWSVDVVGPPPAFEVAFTVRLDRLSKRRCRSCGHRRVLFALRGYAGNAIISSSPLLCGECARLRP